MPRIDLSERAGTASRIGRWATTAALVVATLLALGAKDARAAVHLGIHAYTTLAELREMFPSAEIKETKAAWLKPDEAFYTVRGSEVVGIIGVKFVEVDAPSTPPEERLLAVAVLWTPEAPIPLARFVSKYGPPDKAGYGDDMEPQRWWTKIGVAVGLTDDEARVDNVFFSFTKEEEAAGLKISLERLKEKHRTPHANPKH